MKVRFIAYEINTAPENPIFAEGTMPSGTYLGLPDATEDIEARALLLTRALEAALNAPPPAEPVDLNLFMAPEFFFRGRYGAYTMEAVQIAVERLRTLASGERFARWLFVFGSIVGHSFQPGEVGREAYNFAVVQRGGVAAGGDAGTRIVQKELQSGIDFIATHANEGGILAGGVVYLPGFPPGAGRERQRVEYDGQGIFDLAEVTWGLEVCLDHGMGRLQLSPQLPGDREVAVQLIPSCGMGVYPEYLVTQENGFVFHCDGAGFGVTAAQVRRNDGVVTLQPLAQTTSPVPDDPLTLGEGSSAKRVAIRELFAGGAGRLHLFTPAELPAPAQVQGATEVLQWLDPEHRFNLRFFLGFDLAGRLLHAACLINLPGLFESRERYLLPFTLLLPGPEGPMKIAMKLVRGSARSDLWCEIDIPRFRFEGSAVSFTEGLRRNIETCW